MRKDANAIAIWGCRGAGKSTRIKELIKDKDRVIIVDVMNEYGSSLGVTQFKTLKGLFSHIHKNWNKGFKVSLSMMHLMGEEGAETRLNLFRELCKSLFVIQKPYAEEKDSRTIHFVIDEMKQFVPNEKAKKGSRIFEDVMSMGRHYGINVIGGSQRISEVSTNFRGNTQETYYLMQDEAVDIDACKRSIGKLAEQVALLEPHEFLHKKGREIEKGINDFAKKQA